MWLAQPPLDLFDVAIVDFPDPHNFSLGKLYTPHFYALLRAAPRPRGRGRPCRAPRRSSRASRSGASTAPEAAGFHVRPYHALVPSFGEWGFALGTARPRARAGERVIAGLRYLDRRRSPRCSSSARTWPASRSRSTASTTRRSSATTRTSGGAGTESAAERPCDCPAATSSGPGCAGRRRRAGGRRRRGASAGSIVGGAHARGHRLRERLRRAPDPGSGRRS